MSKRIWPSLLCGAILAMPMLSSSVMAVEGTSLATKIELPNNLTWINNPNEPLFSSDKAKFGGVYRTFDTSFPQTFRTVGPDSNGSFRAWLLAGNLSLVDMHPNTTRTIWRLIIEPSFIDIAFAVTFTFGFFMPNRRK